MSEMTATAWVLSSGLEYEGSHALAVFPGPQEAAAYLESLGVRVRGHYPGVIGRLTPGWDVREAVWHAELDADDGYGDYAVIRQVPWNPAPEVKEAQDG